MELSREDVLHIAKLAKMSLEDEEIDQMRDKLSDILKNFEILQTIDTESVEPTSQPNELYNATKPDIVVPSLSHELWKHSFVIPQEPSFLSLSLVTIERISSIV